MKKTRRCAAGALALMLTLSGCGGQQTQEQSETGGAKTLAQAQSAYLEHVDLEDVYKRQVFCPAHGDGACFWSRENIS